MGLQGFLVRYGLEYFLHLVQSHEERDTLYSQETGLLEGNQSIAVPNHAGSCDILESCFPRCYYLFERASVLNLSQGRTPRPVNSS